MEQKREVIRKIEDKVSKDLKFVSKELSLEPNKRSSSSDKEVLRKLQEAHSLLERAYGVQEAFDSLLQEVDQ